ALKLNDEIGDSDEASATVVAKADETAKVAVNDQHRDEAADSIPGTEGGELAVDVALCDESLPGATETDEISLQPSQATPSRAVVAMNADELPDLDDSRATAAEIPGNARELLTQPIDPDTIDEGFLTDTGEIVEDEELPELDDVAESKKEPAFKQSFWQAQTPEDEMRTELAVNAQRNDLENELLSEKLLPRAMTEKKKPKHDSKPQTDESSFNMAALFGTTETKKAKKAKKKAADTPKNVPGKNDAAHNEEAKRADATDKVKAQTPKANATVKAKEVKPQSGNLAPGTSDSADSVAARPEFALVPDTFVDLPVVPEAPPRVFFNEPLTAKSATVQEKVANEDAKPEETAKPGQVTAVDEPIEVVEPDIYAQKPSAGNLKTTASAKVKKPKRGATQTKPQTSEQQIKRAREMVESMESQLVSGFGIWIKDGITTDPYTGCMSTNSYSFEQAVNDAGLDPDTVELCFEDRKFVVPHVAWNRDTRKLLLIEVL
ncbi:MAG: hypothetical protein Q4E62_05475, partial [Sutterellaceae bacterium]|nr:hypothetical protein [Sutterellaceae bacterium]